MYTPWGYADHVKTVGEGIKSINTPSHGGYWVDEIRLKAIRAKFPKLTRTWAGFPWFEEDCDWVYVVLTFPQYFKPGHVAAAEDSYRLEQARKLKESGQITIPAFDPYDCGGAFDGNRVISDADPGL